MNTLFRVMIAAIFVCALMPNAMSAANVEETVMVAKGKGAGWTVSQTGSHFAAVTNKGSRVIVIVDGNEGPKFDQILQPNGSPYFGSMADRPSRLLGGPVVFSSDGSHYAYAAKTGAEYVVILDGKEVLRGAYGSTVLSYGELKFVGQHLFFIAYDDQKGYCFQTDDKAAPCSHRELTDIAISNDGAHYAYNGMNPDGTQFTVADGKQMPLLGTGYRFTGSGFLVNTVQVAPNVMGMMVNGKTVMKAYGINQIWTSDKSDMVAAMISPSVNDPTAFLTVNTKPVPDTKGVMVDQVYFSPDGKHFAAHCQTPANSHYMIVDGKKEQEYQSIDVYANVPKFSEDSSKFVYVASNNSRNFVVINGEESDALETITVPPVFGGRGQRVAYGYNENGNMNSVMVIDGNELPGRTRSPQNFAFSPDGSRYAFAVGAFKSSMVSLVVDGKDMPKVTVSDWSEQTPDNKVLQRSFLFSPDGKHIAYMAYDPNVEGSRGLWLDGKLVAPVGGNAFPQRVFFSADSNHIFWTVSIAPTEELPQGQKELYVDGTPVMKMMQSDFVTAPVWEMGADNALTFFAYDGQAIKRYRVTASEGDIAGLLAKTT